MSWLARLEIDAEVLYHRGITNDIYVWHQRLWDCYPNEPAAKRDFLTRIDPLDGAYRFWILARRKPACPPWCPPECFALKEIAPSFFDHRYYAFDLRASPVKTLVQRGPQGETLMKENGKRKSGKRVPLVKREDLHAWIIQKGKVRCRDKNTGMDVPGGFCIVESGERPLEISPMIESHFHKKDHRAYHGGVQFRGIMEVTDKDSFVETYHNGLGSGKSFGFGLLLLAPMNM